MLQILRLGTLILAALILAPALGEAQSANGRTVHTADWTSLFSPPAAEEPIGYLSNNRYLPGSTGSSAARYQYTSPANPYGPYGSAYSRDGARNAYTTGGASVIGAGGQYLGRLNANRYDPESVSNPYGRYGSPYSPESINNPYGRYGSAYSPLSARNPYATRPPRIYRPRR